jgi:hypothetical protein
MKHGYMKEVRTDQRINSSEETFSRELSAGLKNPLGKENHLILVHI